MFRYIFETSHGFIAKNICIEMMLYSIHTGSTAANNHGESHRGRTLLVLMAGCHTIFFFTLVVAPMCWLENTVLTLESRLLHEHSGTSTRMTKRLFEFLRSIHLSRQIKYAEQNDTHLRVPVTGTSSSTAVSVFSRGTRVSSENTSS